MDELATPTDLRRLTGLNDGLRAWQRLRRMDAAASAEMAAAAVAAWKAGANERATASAAARKAKRRAAELQQMPAWADLDAIRAVFVEAARLSVATGTPHHVDHILPLQGRRVSGLHVANNLRAIHARDNVRKHNNFEPC